MVAGTNTVAKFVNSLSSTMSNPGQWLIDWFRGDSQASGVHVNVRSVIGHPPVAYAVNKISGPISTLPLKLYRRDGTKLEFAESHPAYRLVQVEPNQYQTAIVFRQTMMMHALLYGNARAAILRSGGVPSELIILPPESTYTCLVDGDKWHYYYPENDDQPLVNRENVPKRDLASETKTAYKFLDKDVLHILGFTWNGYTGLSIIDVAKEALGISLAGQKAIAHSFANGSRPSIVIEAPKGELRDAQKAEEFLNAFNDAHAGIDNAGKAALIREGMKISAIQVSASDAQWLEQRMFQRVDLAMLLGLEHIPGDDSSVSYNSLEQKNQAFVTNCLHPWLERWEQECSRKLLGAASKASHFFRFDTNEFMRPSARERAEYYQIMTMIRAMSPNDVRAKEYMNPYDGGDVYENPMITPALGTDDVAPESPPPQREDENIDTRLITARLMHLIGVESARVVDAAKRKKDFLGWIDAWYPSWEKTITKAIVDFGGQANAAQAHCQQSKSQLIELSGTVTQDGLADAVAEMVADWESRAEAITNHILSQKEPQKCIA